MRAPVHVICRHPAALGVALAGVAPIEAQTGAEAAAAIASIGRARGKAGVVLIEAGLYEDLPAATLRQIRKEGTPIVSPFPGPAPLAPGALPEQELLDVLGRAVGYRMRIR